MSEKRGSGMSLGVFLPLLIMAVTLVVQIFFQNGQIRRERELLATQWAQQRGPMEEAQKLRNQLQSIAGATAVLAKEGNANAILIRDQLAAQGITIKPPE